MLGSSKNARPHFQTYVFAIECWRKLANTLKRVFLTNFKHTLFLEIIDHYLFTSPIHTIRLMVLFKTIWLIWKQQNLETYHNRNRSFASITPLTKSLHLMEAAHMASQGRRKQTQLQTAFQGLCAFLDPQQ